MTASDLGSVLESPGNHGYQSFYDLCDIANGTNKTCNISNEVHFVFFTFS